MNKDRYVSKMLLSFESIILVVSNRASAPPTALAHKPIIEDRAGSSCVHAMYPNDFLTDLLGKSVRIKLTTGHEYQGELASYSVASSHPCRYFQVVKTEEWINGQFAGMLGEVVVSLDFVFYIRAATGSS